MYIKPVGVSKAQISVEKSLPLAAQQQRSTYCLVGLCSWCAWRSASARFGRAKLALHHSTGLFVRGEDGYKKSPGFRRPWGVPTYAPRTRPSFATLVERKKHGVAGVPWVGGVACAHWPTNWLWGDWLCPKKKVNAQESPKLIQQYFVGWTIIWPDETHKLGSNTAIKGIVSIAIASEYAC